MLSELQIFIIIASIAIVIEVLSKKKAVWKNIEVNVAKNYR